MPQTTLATSCPTVDPCERADLTPGQADALIARYIEPDPLELGPSEAQVVGHGVAVWALMTYLRSVGGDIGRAAGAYRLEPAAVEAAVRYYCRHRALIDARIALSQSYFTS